MKYSLETFLYLAFAMSLFLLVFGTPIVGASMFCVVIPISLIVIGLTSPQNGRQLDPSGRKYFFVIFKVWVMTIGLMILFGCACALSEDFNAFVNSLIRQR
ncbi:MAG: hypothetical protein JNL67_02300 [Planctomycetaceae bacterium]|nr:hypothetical protein [Planctomycetaceae bacterium]